MACLKSPGKSGVGLGSEPSFAWGSGLEEAHPSIQQSPGSPSHRGCSVNTQAPSFRAWLCRHQAE